LGNEPITYSSTGGHVMFFLLYDISGKTKDKFLENAQMVGFIITYPLLLFANRDIYKTIVGSKKKKSVIFICTNQMIAYLCTLYNCNTLQFIAQFPS
jgi:hypothetical protein